MNSKLSRPGAALSRPGASVPGAAPPGPRSEERERRSDVVRKARDFLIHVETLGRLLNIHEPANAAVQTALEDLVKDVRELQATGDDLSLIFAEGHAFVNGVWMHLDASSATALGQERSPEARSGRPPDLL